MAACFVTSECTPQKDKEKSGHPTRLVRHPTIGALKGAHAMTHSWAAQELPEHEARQIEALVLLKSGKLTPTPTNFAN